MSTYARIEKELSELSSSLTVTCFICNKPILLHRVNTDERGHSVHEECHVLKIQAKRLERKQRRH